MIFNFFFFLLTLASILTRNYLDSTLPHRWIGRASDSNLFFSCWPPRSPDLTPCDFFLWGYVKDKVYVPPLPESLDELKRRIKSAIKTVYQEIDYRFDICRVTNGSHIEHL